MPIVRLSPTLANLVPADVITERNDAIVKGKLSIGVFQKLENRVKNWVELSFGGGTSLGILR